MYIASLITPSNRALNYSKRSIDSGVNFVKSTPGFSYCVSNNNTLDNSKIEYINSINCGDVKAVNADNESGAENWVNAIRLCESMYVGVIGDDDFIYSHDEVSGWDYSEGISGYRPNTVIWQSGLGITRCDNFEVAGGTPLERVSEFMSKANGNNLTFYSFMRRDLCWKLYDFCNQYHPFASAGYYDWAMTLAYCAAGKILREPAITLVYDNRNWRGSSVDVARGVARLFQKGGYPEVLANHLNLLLAVDAYVLIRAVSRIRDDEEIEKAARFSCMSYLNAYLKSLSPEDRELYKVGNSLAGSRNFQDVIDRCVYMIGIICPDALSRYANYVVAGRHGFQ